MPKTASEPIVNPPATGQSLRLPVGALATAEGNPRRGRVDVIADSLAATGQYRPIVVNKGSLTGRPNEVLAGNHTLLAARSLGWSDIDVWLIDVDEATARRIVLADNRTAELGAYDNDALLALLESCGDDLAGTGYDADDLADLIALTQEFGFPDDSPAARSRDDDDPDEDDDGGRAAPRPPRTGGDGLIDSNDIDEDADRYADKSTRLVVLTMTIPRFIWLQETLTGVRTELGVPTNTDAIIELVARHTGSQPPANDAETDGQ